MADNFSLSCELQIFVHDQQKRIAKARHVDDIQQSLNWLLDVLTNGALPTLELSPSQKSFIKVEFEKKHFVRCSEILLCDPSATFLPFLDSAHLRKLQEFFNLGPSIETFIVLVGALSQLSKLENVSIIVLLLENFITTKRMVDLFVKNCQRSAENMDRGQLNFKEIQIITFLVSLPDRITNKLRQNSKALFFPEVYFTELAKHIQKALEEIHSILSVNSNGVTLKFLSNMIGRISMSGHGKTILAILLPYFEMWVSSSPLWSHICNKVLNEVSDHELEPVLENLLKKASSPQFVSKLLGNSVLTNSRMKYLIMAKFLLLRYYSDFTILRNVIGYLSGCKHRHLLIETLASLLDSWSSGSSVQHTPYSQHFYISCGIVHMMGYLSCAEKETHKHDLLKKLLVGVQNHLENPEHKVRRLGMIVAECVTSVLEPNAEKLAFEYDKNEESVLLQDLLKGPESKLVKINSVNNTKSPSKSKGHPQENGTNVEEKSSTCHDDDGDDDLKPYDLDEEDYEGGKRLLHLRDCMEALIESKEVEKFEAALNSLEKIVKSHPSDLEEVCIELIKILLHLQDQFSTENFVTLRLRCIVAITTRCPISVSAYLTEEFYGANYSIIQRLDMLDVLAESAKELAQPVELTVEKATSKRFQFPTSTRHEDVAEIPEWKKIVQERIDKKTRRFAKGPSKEQPKAVANKFAKVAGHFFYPLMKNFDTKVNTVDLLGDDNILLNRLIYTLGVIIHCATGAPGVHNMGVALIEFSWVLRYHHEPLVRQMLVFALVMVFTSVPFVLLLSENKEGLFEVHSWLKDLVERDDCVDVKRTAVQALIVLEEAFKKEVLNDAKD